MHRSTLKYRRAAAKRINPERVRLNAMVKSAHKLSNGSAGARSISHIVTNEGVPLSRYPAKSYMKRLGLVSTQLPAHRYRKASQPHNNIPTASSLQRSRTRSSAATRRISGRESAGHRSYLAVVLDLYARKPIGWVLSNSPNSELTASALSMAYESRRRPEGVIFHSDQGSHYTSLLFRQNILRYRMM